MEVTRMKVGKYKIPDLRLFPDIHDDVKLIYDNYRLEEAQNEDTVAKLLKHKHASGGSWWSKLADMRLYGLLEPRGIKLTQLAERLTYGTEEEKQNAIKETALNIPLWKELYAQFGNELPDSNFWVQLQRITGLDPKDARNYADFVRKAYLEDISHIKAEKEEENMAGQEGAEKFDNNPAIPEEAFGRFSLKGVGYVDVTDMDTYGIAEAYMKVLAKKLKNQPKSEQEGC